MDLAGCGDIARGDGGGGEVFGKAGGEFFLFVLAQALHEDSKPLESEIEAAGVGVGHRLDDLRECFYRAVRVGLQVLVGEILDFAEPIVLDGLVEEGRVCLVAVVGTGVFLEVLRQLIDERAIVAGLDLGDSAGGRLGRSLMMDERDGSQCDGGPVFCRGPHGLSSILGLAITLDSGDW